MNVDWKQSNLLQVSWTTCYFSMKSFFGYFNDNVKNYLLFYITVIFSDEFVFFDRNRLNELKEQVLWKYVTKEIYLAEILLILN